MINEKNLSKSYWPETANTTVYLINRCTTSGVHDVTHHEKFFEKKPDLSHTRIFSSISYMHIPDEKRQKLDPKSEKCILVGYSIKQKGYKCYNPSTQKLRVSQYIVVKKTVPRRKQGTTCVNRPLHVGTILLYNNLIGTSRLR